MLPKNIHQIIALALYAVCIAVLFIFKKAVFLVLLAAAHLCEYLFISRKLAEEKGIGQSTALVNTLLYGFTWWKPIKEGSAD